MSGREQLSQETMNVLKTLVARVARAFYGAQEIVVLDVLNKVTSISDSDMANKLKVKPRDLHKICGRLRDDRLMKQMAKSVSKENQRTVHKTYYYIDYKQFVDVVKWKMYKMQHAVRETLRNESENKGYICPNPACERTYDALAVLKTMNSEMQFQCDVCDTLLIQNDNDENVRGSKEQVEKFLDQTEPIITLLKRTDNLVIPAAYASEAVEAETRKYDIIQTETTGANRELAYAQDTGAGKGDIVVIFQDDNDATKKAKREEAERKRQQNALPAWHMKSTVSGELTSAALERMEVKTEEDEEFVKEEKGDEDESDNVTEYYQRYYASLQSNPSQVDGDEDFEAVKLEEGKKRTFDDEIDDGISSKRVRLDGSGSIEEDDEIDGIDDMDLPEVTVQGSTYRLDEVTEAEMSKMTDEEYEHYAKLREMYIS